MGTKVNVVTEICEQEITLEEKDLYALLQCDSISLDGDEPKKIKSKIFETSNYGKVCAVKIIAE